MTILNEEKKHRELKESITMMNSQRSDVEKIILIEEGKKLVLMKLLIAMKLTITVYNNKYVWVKMKSFCLKCRKNAENINPRVSNTSNGRKAISSKCAICGSKKSRFIKDQEAKGLLTNLGVRKPLSKVPIFGWYFVLNMHAKVHIKNEWNS